MRMGFFAILAALAFAGGAAAQSTALTYQGRLNSGGQPASGLHDFRFKLFNAPTGGSQIGQTQCADNVPVSDGLLTTPIDFGQQFATPNQRYLEIEVRRDTGLGCGNGSGFVVLVPRQLLTAAPLASHASSAFALDAADGSPANAVFVDNGGNVGLGTTAPLTRLDVRGGPMSVENIGDQADLLWLNSERTWVFRQEGVGAGTALKLQSIGGGGNKNFFFQTDGAVGIRSTAGRNLFVPGGEENLRIIRGTVNSDGSIALGSGFTSSRFSAGLYQIAFTAPFAGVPTVTVTATGFLRMVAAPSITATGVDVGISCHSDGHFCDSMFNFIAVGPR